MSETPQSRPRGWSLVWRYMLATTYCVGTLLVLAVFGAMEDDGLNIPRYLWDIELLLGGVGLFLIRFRHRRPVTTALVLVGLTTFAASVGLVAWWALVHLAARRRWREILPVAGTYVSLSMVAILLQTKVFRTVPFTGGPQWLYLQGFVWALLTVGLSVAVGFSMGARRDLLASLRQRADEAERNQELMVLQGQASERNRIAREMHDVLAHRISLVSMHAGALAYRTDLSADQTREIATLIQDNAHQSLTELRGVLGSLRDESAGMPGGAAIEKPQPTMRQIEDLVREARAAGEKIDHLDETEHPELLPTLTGRHAYRVVQEALTNARKHAPHARVSLTVSGRPGEGLVIRCRNPLTSGSTGVPGSGMGLLGLGERAQVTGGRISHGVTDDRFFDLEVWLPW